MCGFVGELNLRRSVDPQILYRMNNALQHRGPDESAVVVGESRLWGLAHRRLNIVDPAGGRQPMADRLGRRTLVFNGEIYDDAKLRRELERDGFEFRGYSDTEVVLALYCRDGMAALSRLRGEFALAIIDEDRHEAFLVRDRMGIKPLFFMPIGDRFLFASEVKALFQDDRVPREVDPTGLLGAIAVADVPGRTLFRNVHQVRNAHYVRVDLRTLEWSTHRYWDALDAREQNIPARFEEQVERVRQTVDEAIRVRLRADVPVGAYLSGGVDSSIVARRAAAQVDHLHAFGLAFEDSPRHNEFPFAEEVARQAPNIELHRVPVTHREMVRRLPETVWHLERPFANLHSVAKLICARYARQHVRCVLTGDGGDESFCGYSTHWLQNELQQADYSLSAIRTKLRSMQREAAKIGGNRYYLATGLARRIGPETAFLADSLGFRPCDVATGWSVENGVQHLMDPDFVRSVQSPTQQLVAELAQQMPPGNSLPHATLLQYVQMNSSVPEYINVVADRTENAGSIEARMPLFDHHVVELAMGLPLESKLSGDREKWVLRQAYRDVLPKSVLTRRKQAFLAPPAPFVSPEGKMLVETYLSPSAIKEVGIWSPSRIAALRTIRRLLPRNRFVNQVINIVLTTQIMMDQFIIHRPGWRMG
jgi:asparagine synthase (glutamine-hydrolysing)